MSVLGCSLVIGCSSLVGVDKGLSAEERDRLQREMRRPEPSESGVYVTATAGIDVDGDFEQVTRWFRERGVADLEMYMSCGGDVPVSAKVEPLTGEWPAVSARRRLVFDDGNSVVEELVEPAGRDAYRYVAWNLTTETGKYVEYAIATLTLTAAERGAHLAWTYAYKPKGWWGIPDRWFIGSYVRERYQACMQKALAGAVTSFR